MSQKNPGSYGAFQKLPKPENPTQFTTYYGQKSSDTKSSDTYYYGIAKNQWYQKTQRNSVPTMAKN